LDVRDMALEEGKWMESAVLNLAAPVRDRLYNFLEYYMYT
jgi:hypothetical protein